MKSTECRLNKLIEGQSRLYRQMISETNDEKRQNAMIEFIALDRKIERIMQEE